MSFMRTTIDLIFLDKRDSNATWDWKYYRVTGLEDAIEVCVVEFPGLTDTDIVVSTPGNVGLAAAYDNVAKVLKNK